ncbi:MAG: type II secretion system protein GspN [Nitrospirae bacterium]|nr:type II secretion system protein GspN [Nitrospirota bacterium]
MKKVRYLILVIAAIPVFIILVWFFAVPDTLIKERIEESISGRGQGNISANVTGFRKGIFFSAGADALEISLDGMPALTITELEGSFNPRQLLSGGLVFSIKGRIGTGAVTGTLQYPSDGEIKIEAAELSSIPYLSRAGIDSGGYVSSVITIKDNSARIEFRVPDLAVRGADSVVPFIETFHKTQGVISVTGNDVMVESLSLEGEKGFARLKGGIKNGTKDLSLELMPDMKKLNSLESMLIGKYQVSPGYYVIPVKGTLTR